MKRIQKGFTLIELIVVLAIFGIILTLVMSFIDPVAKIMKKASVRERTAAYVDNIGEYIDNSLHYAEFMRVYNGGFTDASGNALPGTDDEFREQYAVRSLIADCLNGAVNDMGDPIGGKVRVLKFINSPTGSFVEGQIYESVYGFFAGETFEIKDDAGNVVATPVHNAPVASIIQENKKIVNDEHLEEYSYYYNTGFYSLDNLDDPDKYSAADGSDKSYAPTNRTYYSTLYPILYEKDHDGLIDDPLTMNTLSNENLCINVVAYQNGNKEFVNHELDDGSVETVPVFLSPSHLTSTSMSLINVIGTHDVNTPVYVRLKRKADGTPDKKGTDFQFQNQMTVGNPYSVYTANDSINDGNVYVVFIMPDEINDTNIIYK